MTVIAQTQRLPLPAVFNLSGRQACVLGGAGYLGRAISRQLAEHGARVMVCDYCEDASEQVAGEIAEAGYECQAVALDVGDGAAVAEQFDQIVGDHGELDAVINATSFYRNVAFDQMTLDDWHDGLRINLDAAFVISREAGRVMKPRGRGSIVHFSSMYGMVAPVGELYGEQPINPVHYGVAKAGLLQLVRYQAAEAGKFGVRVNAIVPGPFPSPSIQQSDPEFAQRLASRTMLGRVGKADEIAGAVVYLASDASSYMTGQHMVIDGGWTAW